MHNKNKNYTIAEAYSSWAYDLKIEDIKTKITIDVLWNELVVKKYNSKIVIDETKIKKK